MHRCRGFHQIGEIAAMAMARHAARDIGEGGDKVGWRFHWCGRAIAGRIIIIGQEHHKPRH
jgi:hypothetical protein